MMLTSSTSSSSSSSSSSASSHAAAEQINQSSLMIVKGQYENAVVSLTRVLKILKFVLDKEEEKEAQYYRRHHYCNDGFMDDSANDDGVVAVDNMSSSSSSSKTRNNSRRREGRSSSCPPILPSRSNIKYDFLTSSDCPCFLDTDTYSADDTSSTSSSMDIDDDLPFSFYDEEQLKLSIFRDPILIRSDLSQASTFDMHNYEQLSYVALHNLALSYHLMAFTATTSSSQDHDQDQEAHRMLCLQKALSLYECTHKILMKEAIAADVPVIHTMALITNMGHIHKHIGNYCEAFNCLQFLLSTMITIIDHNQIEILGNYVDGLFTMIIPLILENNLLAPAA